jgi:transposase-like protein
MVVLGIAADGQKQVLGVWDCSTENAAVSRPPPNLQSRGLRTIAAWSVILDGAQVQRNVVRATFGEDSCSAARSIRCRTSSIP